METLMSYLAETPSGFFWAIGFWPVYAGLDYLTACVKLRKRQRRKALLKALERLNGGRRTVRVAA